MKKLLITIPLYIACGGGPTQRVQSNKTNDSIQVKRSVVESMCRDAMRDTFTAEEAAHWDSMNAEGGYLLIRGAERNLDTIVNHYHFKFITEP